MKFTAAILFAVASASVEYEQEYAEPAYEQEYAAPAYESYEPKYPQRTTYTKAYTSNYKKLDIDAVVTELNRRNEAAVRAVRDEEFATIQALTLAERDAVDALISEFEADILALREAMQASRDAKRAEIAAADEAIRATSAALIAQNAADIAALNEAQENLLAEILLADMYYDHTRIAKLLDRDGKETALSWEDEPYDPVDTVYESYLSWNQREPAEREYQETWLARDNGYGYGHWGY